MGDAGGAALMSVDLYLWALAALILGATVLLWPLRRTLRFRLERVIAAPRDRVWATYRYDPSCPDSAAFHGEVVASRKLPDDPAVEEHVVDLSKGNGTVLTAVRFRTLAEQAPAFLQIRVCDIDGRPYPFGRVHSDTVELFEHPDGTRAVQSVQFETQALWQFFALRASMSRTWSRRKIFCETGALSEPRLGRSFWICLALSVLAIGSFALWLGWIGALLLAAVLVVHEFGHWLAMRMTGQPAPRLLLLPFLGGVAVANHPHKSLFDDAFCCLMGPGFSALPCLLFLLVAFALGVPDLHDGWQDVISDFSIPELVALLSVLLAATVGVVNALQLLPLLPLDGGHILRAVVQSFRAAWTRPVLLVLAGLGTVGSALAGEYILAAVLALGALQAWWIKHDIALPRPMGAPGISAICLGYGLVLAVHAGAVFYSLQLFRIDLF